MRYLLLVSFFFITPPASAQTVCDERNKIVAELDEKYHETSKYLGLTNGGGVVEIFVSKSGSWTILVTMPDGMSCLVSTGENWADQKIKKIGSKI